MSIKQVNKDGKTLYFVYESYRSKKNTKIRAQRKRHCKTKEEAIKMSKALRDEVIYSVLKKEGLGKSLSEILDEWYHHHTFDPTSNLSDETREDYYSAVKNWYGHLLKEPADKIAKSDIKRVINKAKDLNKSNSFQSKLKIIMNIIYKWAIEEGVLANVSISPASGISLSKKIEKKPEILTVKQARHFLQVAKHLEHPWYPIWATALLTGCRSGELIALTWDDINFESNKINVNKSYNTRRKQIKSTKAGYYRTVPINSELHTLLLSLSNKANTSSDRVLPQFTQWTTGMQAQVLRGFLEMHGLPSVKFHTLRACFATMLLEQKVAPIAVMKVCGWRDLDTMARYVRLAGLDEEGATQGLSLLPEENIAKVISMSSKDKRSS
jgi:integrase